jgi:hypothetical protein
MQLAREVDGKFVSGFIHATKPAKAQSTQAAEPAAQACCAPSCCGGR